MNSADHGRQTVDISVPMIKKGASVLISAYLSFFVCFVSSLEQKMGLRSPTLGKALGLSIMNVKKETGGFFNLNTVNNLPASSRTVTTTAGVWLPNI